MQKKKTRSEIVIQTYLKKRDIQILLGITQNSAKTLFEKADMYDRQELNDYRVEPYKVRMSTVCKLAKISFNQLIKQIEMEEKMKKTLA